MKILFLFITFICLNGCTSSNFVSQPAGGDSLSLLEFINEVKGEHCRIELSDGRIMEGKNLEVTHDSIRWVDVVSAQVFTISTVQIDVVVCEAPWLGALEGFGVGVVVGGTAGFLSSEEKDKKFAGELAPLYLASAGGLAGGIVGGIIGLVLTHDYEYKFVRKK